MSVFNEPELVVERGFTAISMETICEFTAPAFDIYLRRAGDRYVLFYARHTSMTRAQRDRLRREGRRVLYIKSEDRNEYYRYLGDNLDKLLQDRATTIDHKASIVYDAATHTVMDVLDNPSDPHNIERAEEVARHTASLVTSANSVETILGMTSFDYSTHTHSVNVALYGVSLAREMEVTDAGRLADLSIGLLLHDVGKARIDPKVLNKPARLTPEEFEHMKGHTALGEELLLSNRDVPEVAARIAGQHHERFGGDGYPRRMRGDAIDGMARLAAVVDVFDALTTRRAYKEPMPSFEALRLMHNETDHFDPKVLVAFIRMLGHKHRQG